MLLYGAYTPYPALVCLSSSKTDPSVYMLCCGGNLRGGSWGKVGRGGASWGVNVGMVGIWAFFQLRVGSVWGASCAGDGVRVVEEMCG